MDTGQNNRMPSGRSLFAEGNNPLAEGTDQYSSCSLKE
jgi:hypothetical protein